MLAVTEPALDPDPFRASVGLSSILATLGDQSWASEIGMEISVRLYSVYEAMHRI